MRRRTISGFTTEQLVDSLAYLGYSTASWDCRVRRFILGKNNRNFVFNLNFTVVFLKNSLSFFFNLCLKRGVCAIVNENFSFNHQLNAYFDVRVRRFQWLFFVSKKLKRGVLSNYKLLKLRQKLFKIVPHVSFVSSPSHSPFFLAECALIGIPTISVCDTNLFPVKATYVIPSNEKSFDNTLLLNTLFYLYFVRSFITRTNIFVDKIVLSARSSRKSHHY